MRGLSLKKQMVAGEAEEVEEAEGQEAVSIHFPVFHVEAIHHVITATKKVILLENVENLLKAAELVVKMVDVLFVMKRVTRK
jgi:hypothetical protein